MKKIIFYILVCQLQQLFSNFCIAQNSDSLLKIYNNKLESDTNRLKAIQTLAWNNIFNNTTEAIVLAKKELELAQKTQHKKYESKALTIIGSAYLNQSNYLKALEYYLKALKINEEINDKKGIGACYNNLGIVFWYQRNLTKALEYYSNALKINLELNDKKGIGNCNANIGLIYTDKLDYTNALEYHNRSLKIREEINDKQGIAASYTNIGIVYDFLSDHLKAIDFYLKAVKIKEEIDDKQGLVSSYVNLGGIYIKLNNYNKAILYCNKAIQVSKYVGDINNERYANQTLSEIYSKIKDYEKAYYYHVRFKVLTDSIFNEENSKQLGDIKTQFEVEKKEAELKSQQEKRDVIANEEKKKQRMVLIFVSGFLLIVGLLAILIFKNLRKTKKQKVIIELKERETQQQNEIITIQKHLVEEKHKEITDSINYAERIQRSFLATEKQLNENLNNYFVLFKPKDVVSGDFYWSAKLSNGNFALATADSTGHGVPGAIMSLLNVTSLEKAIEHYTNPADILNHTRQTIIERLKKDGSEEGGKDGMDCSLLVFDVTNKQLLIAAANNPVWIIRSNSPFEGGVRRTGDVELIEIKPDKMPVGKSDKQDQSFTTRTIDLQKGDTIYTLTDGFPDQFGGPNGKKFMSKKLKELLLANVHLSIAQQKELLDLTFNNWVGDLEQVDDVTVIGIRI